MAKPSKKTRKLRNLKKQLDHQTFSKNVVKQALTHNRKLAQIAIEEHEKSKRLAKLLAFVVAKTGGRLVVPDRELAELPDDAKLGEEYDAERGLTVLVSIAPKEKDGSKVEVVRPAIEVVSR